jgi:hypothetical protein
MLKAIAASVTAVINITKKISRYFIDDDDDAAFVVGESPRLDLSNSWFEDRLKEFLVDENGESGPRVTVRCCCRSVLGIIWKIRIEEQNVSLSIYLPAMATELDLVPQKSSPQWRLLFACRQSIVLQTALECSGFIINLMKLHQFNPKHCIARQYFIFHIHRGLFK